MRVSEEGMEFPLEPLFISSPETARRLTEDDKTECIVESGEIANKGSEN
jgi:hypothetical protein